MRGIAFSQDWRFRVGLVVTLLALIGLALVPYQVLDPRFGSRSIAFSPKAFPIITLGLMALLGLVMALEPAFRSASPDIVPPEGKPRPRVLTAMAVVTAYVVVAEHIGMIAASGLAIAALSYVLGTRSIITILALAVSVPAGIWLVFKVGLKVFLPEGTLFEGMV